MFIQSNVTIRKKFNIFNTFFFLFIIVVRIIGLWKVLNDLWPTFFRIVSPPLNFLIISFLLIIWSSNPVFVINFYNGRGIVFNFSICKRQYAIRNSKYQGAIFEYFSKYGKLLVYEKF